MRPVKVGVHHNNIATIESGLKAGDKVVVDGQMQLAPNAQVNISTN
jgi:multidrug efflux pump subunit AcrA (membrane-fusion protein)